MMKRSLDESIDWYNKKKMGLILILSRIKDIGSLNCDFDEMQ